VAASALGPSTTIAPLPYITPADSVNSKLFTIGWCRIGSWATKTPSASSKPVITATCEVVEYSSCTITGQPSSIAARMRAAVPSTRRASTPSARRCATISTIGVPCSRLTMRAMLS
jgi:hypothetical protein